MQQRDELKKTRMFNINLIFEERLTKLFHITVFTILLLRFNLCCVAFLLPSPNSNLSNRAILPVYEAN